MTETAVLEQTAAPAAPAAPARREKRKYASPVVMSTDPLKGFGQIRTGDLPQQFRKDLKGHLRSQSLPKWGGSVHPWFYYTEGPIGAAPDGTPYPPGLFSIFWVHDADQGGAYAKLRDLKTSPGNKVLLEFAAQDVVTGTYSAEDWATIQWAARRALKQKVGAHPTRTPKVRPKTIKYLEGYQVEVGKLLKGHHTVTFADGPHAGGKTRVTPECLGETAEESKMIQVPAYIVKMTVHRPAYTPYEPRFALDAFDEEPISEAPVVPTLEVPAAPEVPAETVA